MKHLIKKYWWCVLVFILLLSLPLFLNWIVTRDIIFDYKVAGDSKDWLSFWVIYFSALTSLAMVVITWCTLKQNKEQLDEIKRQWKESTRPYLLVSIKEYSHSQNVDGSSEDKKQNTNEYLLVIENCGNSVAKDVQITFDKAFVDGIKYKEVKDSINYIMKAKISIAPHGKYVFRICNSVNTFNPRKDNEYKEFEEFLNYFKDIKITITLIYNGYIEDKIINTSKDLLLWTTRVVDELDCIKMSIDDLKKVIDKKRFYSET